jgi:hypothetical protein
LDPREELQWRTLQWLQQQPADDHLPLTKKLASIFPTGPHLSDEWLSSLPILRVCYTPSFNPILLISCQFWSWSKAWATQIALIRGRSRKVRIVLTSYRCSPLYFSCPSSRRASKPLTPYSFAVGYGPFFPHWARLADLLGGDQPPVHLGRPGGAPAVIFNPALASLQQRLDHL